MNGFQKRQPILGLMLFWILMVFQVSASSNQDHALSFLNDISKESRADTLISLAEFFIVKNPDTSLYFSEMAYSVSKEIIDKQSVASSSKLMADAYYYKNDMKSAIKYYRVSAEAEEEANGSMSDGYALRIGDVGYCFYVLGIHDLAIENYEKALWIFQHNGNQQEIYNIYNNMGTVYFAWGEVDKALEFFRQTLEHDKKNGHPENISVSYNNIGKVYYAWRNYEPAIEYFTEALGFAILSGNETLISTRLSNLGMVYFDTGKYDKALEMLSDALKLDSTNNNRLKVAIRQNELGRVYAAKGNINKAKDFYEQALTTFHDTGVLESQSIVLKDIGDLYKISGDFQLAEQAYLESIRMADKMGSVYHLVTGYEGLSDLMEKSGNFEKALEYYKQSQAQRRIIFNSENQRQMANFEIKYETEKKELENDLLRNENALKERRLQLAGVFLIGLILIVLLLVFLVRLRTRSLKQQKELNRLEVEKREKEKQHLEDKIFAEKEINRLQREKLSAELKHKSEQLATSTLSLINKNEALRKLKAEIKKLDSNGDNTAQVTSLIVQNIDTDHDWNKFSVEFEKVHPGFFTRLHDKYPDFSENSVKLCAYLRMGLSSKDIAGLSNVSVAAINKNRQRLRKKLELDSSTDLTTFFSKL